MHTIMRIERAILVTYHIWSMHSVSIQTFSPVRSNSLMVYITIGVILRVVIIIRFHVL